MIGFYDFKPEVTPGLFGGQPQQTLDDVLRHVNSWISEHDVDVVSIETVVAPTLGLAAPKNTKAHCFFGGSYWYQFLRVWFRY